MQQNIYQNRVKETVAIILRVEVAVFFSSRSSLSVWNTLTRERYVGRKDSCGKTCGWVTDHTWLWRWTKLSCERKVVLLRVNRIVDSDDRRSWTSAKKYVLQYQYSSCGLSVSPTTIKPGNSKDKRLVLTCSAWKEPFWLLKCSSRENPARTHWFKRCMK